MEVYFSELVISNCDIVHNHSGVYSQASVVIDNSIIWGNDDFGVYNNLSSGSMIISYCCVQTTDGDLVGGYGIDPENFTNNLTSDPVFLESTAGYGPDYDALAADWRISHVSPCLDAGNPFYSPNEDGSPWDIGLYQRACRPAITSASDYQPDQGHQVDLQWKRSDIDEAFYPFAFYSVWRQTSAASREAVFISDPASVSEGFDPEGSEILWRDGERLWYYLLQVPAVMFGEYGLIVPTLQDSSATGTHEFDFMVMYHNADGFWASPPVSGYSVDNIPPASPERIALNTLGANIFHLSWDPVTEGIWEGNSYPEINPITYKVYAGDTPDFEIGPASFLLSTGDPQAWLTGQTAARRFFCVIASDAE